MDKRLIAVALAAVGAFFVASAYQGGEARRQTVNFFGQFCSNEEGCWHPEWIAVGVGFVGLAVYLWTLKTKD
jgi:hypothetical protein